MNTDLEDEIRAALRDRAMSVTATDLRADEAPPAARNRTILAALAAAAVVAALAVGLAVAVWPREHRDDAPVAAGGGSVVGIRWQFSHGIQGTTNFTSPSRKVFVAFYPGGEYGADDGINGIGGHYRITSRHIELSGTVTTLVGYGGTDPNVLATQAGFAALTSGHSAVTARIGDGQLTLSGPGYTLWFRNAGPAKLQR